LPAVRWPEVRNLHIKTGPWRCREWVPPHRPPIPNLRHKGPRAAGEGLDNGSSLVQAADLRPLPGVHPPQQAHQVPRPNVPDSKAPSPGRPRKVSRICPMLPVKRRWDWLRPTRPKMHSRSTAPLAEDWRNQAMTRLDVSETSRAAAVGPEAPRWLDSPEMVACRARFSAYQA
jgi:hypothetical protein